MLPTEQREFSGRYQYRLDGCSTGIEEFFRINRSEGEVLHIAGHRVAPEGPRLDLQAVMQDAQLKKAKFKWSAPDRTLSCDYSTGDERWQINGQATEFSSGTLLIGLLRVFTGPLLLAIAGRGGKAQVLAPSLETGGMLFQPLISTRTVEELDGAPGAERCFIYRGGPYLDACRCWITADGLLSRYNWVEEEKGIWEVTMVPSNSL